MDLFIFEVLGKLIIRRIGIGKLQGTNLCLDASVLYVIKQ